ncbi:MAG TPA: hypothetical protein VMC62_07320, partial [Longilinea sp.]|nr:hypothetical protein [Longilinea sp.]
HTIAAAFTPKFGSLPFPAKREVNFKEGTLFNQGPFSFNFRYWATKLELIFVKTLPMIGPRVNRTAITTTPSKTKINAYSTSP